MPAEQSPDSHAAPIRPARFVPPAPHRAQRRRLPLRALAATAAAMVAVAATWFVLASRAVFLDLQPPEAHAEVDGFTLPVAGRLLVLPGRYRLRLHAPGYREQEVTLDVGENGRQHHAFALEKLPGHLAVRSSPVAGAEVWVDGALRGHTPLTVSGLAAGTHALRVAAARYRPAEREVVIEGLDRTQQLELTLAPAWAPASVRSDPPGAEVSVDGEVRGVTPLDTDILEGERRLRLTLDGYTAVERTLAVSAGEPLDLPVFALRRADGILMLGSTPAGANVTVDGEFRGRTPLELSLAPDTPHAVRLFKEGYAPAEREVTLAAAAQIRLRVDLEATLGEIAIDTQPADATLLVDGAAREAANTVLSLPARPHRIEVRKPGYRSFTTTVTPRPGIAQQLRVRLASEAAAARAEAPDEVAGANGHRMKRFDPGDFTMGASRREPGRRANETLRPVSLGRAFYLSVDEVSNAQFRAFEPAHRSGRVQAHSLDGDRQPVVRVTWEQAARYCNWLSAREGLAPFYREQEGRITGFTPAATGYRLPTEAEWEWAARTGAGGSLLKFPWGEALPPAPGSVNVADRSASGLLPQVIRDYDDGHAVSAPVGSFAASARGLHDLGGNVAEWVHDFYDVAIGAGIRPARDPLGPESGEFHVIRGASWAHASVTELRLSYRDYGNKERDDVGFRVARYAQ